MHSFWDMVCSCLQGFNDAIYRTYFYALDYKSVLYYPFGSFFGSGVENVEKHDNKYPFNLTWSYTIGACYIYVCVLGVLVLRILKTMILTLSVIIFG